jgi:hypothetical protein
LVGKSCDEDGFLILLFLGLCCCLFMNRAGFAVWSFSGLKKQV